MEYADRKMICEKCHEEYIFPCGEQKFFEEKGFIPPKKCPKCRGKQNVKRPESNNFPTICPECKTKFNITFDPKNQKVLCFECFEKQKKNRS